MALIQQLVSYVFILFFGVPVFLATVFRIIRNPRKFFYKKERPTPPACLTDESIGTHHFCHLKNQNIKLHYVEAGSADKPLMLFLHGFPEFWYSWRFQMQEFKRDYRVVAVDMRGYNLSDKPKGKDKYSMPYLLGDIKELITTLGYEKCTLVAHDWGGLVGWSFSIEYSHMVEKYIVCNVPHPSAIKKFLRSNVGQIFKSWYVFVFQLPWIPEMLITSNDLKMIEVSICGKKAGIQSNMGNFTDEDLEAWKYTFSQPGCVTPPINYYRANFGRDDAARSSKYREVLKVPTLCVWGDRDQFLTTEMAVMSGKYVHDYTLKIVEGASHWVQQDRPDICNAHMRDFLATSK